MKLILCITICCLLVGCDNTPSWDSMLKTPQPSEATFIAWLNGQRVVTKKGLITDDVWTIEKDEVSGFKVLRITTNTADMIYSAVVSFTATKNSSGIQVSEAIIRYKPVAPDSKYLQFVDFVPVSFTRIGN